MLVSNMRMIKKAWHCKDCKKCDTIDITHKRRITCGLIQPCYNYKLDNMIDIINRKCITCNKKRPKDEQKHIIAKMVKNVI
jgi:hypothetical protein